MNGGEGFFFLIVFGIAASIVIRLAAGSMDGGRVRQYITGIGGELLESHWDPFGPGWFGEKNARIYQIRYRDREGCIHRAHVKTSLMSGVYLTNDEIIRCPEPQAAPPRPKHLDLPDKQETIDEEKARLRQRLAELDNMD
ncbi:hypothetical protein [Bremerella alba]|uniref:Uncharacterized protein n=1 Tax=Bremerella alba TaxID=980252 RepID=A0A7V9A8Q8_9BACT|nr:hypothetical protein [Bremerella alba]MBA2116543.1 hypothetical protein [Bremerella alba]